MCLIINKEFFFKFNAKRFAKKPLIAQKDIEVYKKLLKENDCSPFKNFKYIKNKLYTSNFGINISRESYKKPFKYKIEVNEGLHSFVEKTEYCAVIYRIVKMIIPKGSEYFLGCYNDIVSNQLIWKEDE